MLLPRAYKKLALFTGISSLYKSRMKRQPRQIFLNKTVKVNHNRLIKYKQYKILVDRDISHHLAIILNLC